MKIPRKSLNTHLTPLVFGVLSLTPSIDAGVIAYTSFEEPVPGAQYQDTGDATVDHLLVNNDGQSPVNFSDGVEEMGFASSYINSRDGVGLTDGDYVGVTNYTGDVGGFTDGGQGFEMQDADGVMRVTFDVVDISAATNAFVELDLFIVETGWESDDRIRIWVETAASTIDILNTEGSDIDTLGIEGNWLSFSEELTGGAWARLHVELDSNAAVEAIYLDNIRFVDGESDGGDSEEEEVIELSSSTYTSFEEPTVIGGYYTDADAASDHELENNGGPTVAYEGGEELGFRSFYVNTRDDSGLSDGDFLGVTDYTGAVGAYTDGGQGYQLSDTDGLVRLELDPIDMSLVDTEPTLLVDLFVASTGWETSDLIRVWVVTDIGVVDLLNTEGLDIDDLNIEGVWQTLSADLTGATVAEVKVALDSNASGEAIYVDNIRFGPVPQLEPVTIMEIQGSGGTSPLIGEQVLTTGIVTAITADGRSFWIQDALGDDDPSTSDGVYVYSSDLVPEIGDEVSVLAAVSEFARSSRPTDLTVTELVGATVEILSSNNVPPEPILIDDLPDESIPEAIGLLESLEGMRVHLNSALVVGQTNGYGEFHVIAPQDIKDGSGFSAAFSQMLIRSIGEGEVDYNPERLMVDDMTLAESLLLMPGDTLEGVVGVLHYDFSNYRLLPTEIGEVSIERAPTDISDRDWKMAFHRSLFHRRHLDIATLNTENLFDLIDDPDKNDQGTTPTPEFLDTKIQKLAATIAIGLELPEVVCVQEIENQEILQQLGDFINAKYKGSIQYRAVSFETSDARGIETGFLYNERRIKLKDAYQLSDDIVAGVSDAFGPNSVSPGREPLVGVFKYNGKEFTLINNHFRSKGGDEPLYGQNQPAIRSSEEIRKPQAQVVRDFVSLLLGENPDAYVAVMGDFNDFQFAEPGEGEDHPLGILEGMEDEVSLVNVVDTMIPFFTRFSYLYEGNSQVLDHFLVSPSLDAKVRHAKFLHLNAAYLDEYMEDVGVLERSSDHDPLLIEIDLSSRNHRPRHRK